MPGILLQPNKAKTDIFWYACSHCHVAQIPQEVARIGWGKLHQSTSFEISESTRSGSQSSIIGLMSAP